MQDNDEPVYAAMLFLPSLTNHGEFINVGPVHQDEAMDFISNFNMRVGASRKIKFNDESTSDSVEEFKGNLNLKALVEEGSLGDLVEALTKSNIPGKRGLRAVYVDVENDTILVGTTVVYNANWAMLGVEDATILPALLDAVADFA